MEESKALTTTEAAKAIGCAGRTVRVLIQSGKLPGTYRVGSDYRIPPEAVAAYIASTTVPAPAPAAGGGA